MCFEAREGTTWQYCVVTPEGLRASLNVWQGYRFGTALALCHLPALALHQKIVINIIEDWRMLQSVFLIARLAIGPGKFVTLPVGSRLLKMERELNHIFIPYEIGDPRIYNSRISIRTARDYVALHSWQTHIQKRARWSSE
jgi:hypothetical protein